MYRDFEGPPPRNGNGANSYLGFVLGYYRHEGDVGKAADRTSDAFGLSFQQKVGNITLDPGFFSVHDSTLRFHEATTGINHALGSSMMIG